VRLGVVTIVFVAACAAEQPKPTDPCVDKPVVAGGSVEFGRADGAFKPIIDGEHLTLQPAIQHLYMFVVSARTHDLDVGTGDLQGLVEFAARDPKGEIISLQTGCRVLDFMPVAGGYLEFANPFGVPFAPAVAKQIDGTTITIEVVIRDHEGRRATTAHSIVAHMP
jgi:hypothetical protein